MNRINLFRNVSGTKAVRSTTFPGTTFPGNPATLESVTWGKINFEKTAGAVMFAALLIVCSIAVGCSSDKPQPASSNNSPAMTQPSGPAVTTPSAPVMQAAAKAVHKKVVRKAPVMLAYTDKTSGV
jgi:hypothetical protein